MTISGDSPTASTSATCSWTEESISSAVSYEVSIDGADYSDVGLVYSYALTGLAEGTHTCSVRGINSESTAGTAGSDSVIVDISGPAISAISPSVATTGVALDLSVTATDSVSGMDYCAVYIDESQVGAMSAAGDTYSLSYTFIAAGSYSGYAFCEDGVGNTQSGSLVTIIVSDSSSDSSSSSSSSDSSSSDSSSSDSSSGSSSGSSSTTTPISDSVDLDLEILIKMECVDSTDVNDPCRAVYYYSSTDSKRHAFPNEKVYFTWYEDFDDVITVSDEVMAGITLGTNVTYHPGTKMVKFQTLNTVYAVARGGVLRAIASETVAQDLYGSTWNKQIDDISDAFYGNYSFGEDIESASDYDVNVNIGSTAVLEDNF